MNEGARGVCPQHPERFASITCKHCGSYACGDCTVDTLWGDTLCVACDARGHARYPIPWDRSISPWAFVATCRVVFSDLRLMFPSFPSGSVLRAIGFACVMNVLVVGATVLVNALRGGHDSALIGASYSLGNLFAMLSAGVAFYLSQKTLGGQAGLAESVRAGAYLTGLEVVLLVTSFTPAVLGILGMLASVGMWLWGWTLFGQGRARLSSARAIVSAFVTLVTSTVVGFVVLGVWLLVYQAMTGQLAD